MKKDLTDVGGKMIYGGVDQPQPDWRKGDHDDAIDDDDDPAPVSKSLLDALYGFNTDELDAPPAETIEQATARKAAAKKARGKRH
ncbi:MAG TPA: hypothetical protein VKF17_16765 [Isosphaeraceae bacterium]|nr:hypothetical protein [Isosphaeraceae bacterium]